MKDLNYYKKVYDDMKAPDEISDVIRLGIEKSGKVKQRTPMYQHLLLGTAAVFALFVLTLNMFPATAEALGDVPVLGRLVKTFTFNQLEIDGGNITDGSNVSFISVDKNGEKEDIIITFGENEAPHYNVKYANNPAVMAFQADGVRYFDAIKEFEKAVSQSEYIDDIYSIITLDDSGVRFNIQFKNGIDYEVKEYSNPGQIIITVSESQEQYTGTVYSIRTQSMENGEEFGSMEELFYGHEDYRVLKDAAGSMLIEFGNYLTLSEAQVQLKEIVKAYGEDVKLYIEERPATEIPQKK